MVDTVRSEDCGSDNNDGGGLVSGMEGIKWRHQDPAMLARRIAADRFDVVLEMICFHRQGFWWPKSSTRYRDHLLLIDVHLNIYALSRIEVAEVEVVDERIQAEDKGERLLIRCTRTLGLENSGPVEGGPSPRQPNYSLQLQPAAQRDGLPSQPSTVMSIVVSLIVSNETLVQEYQHLQRTKEEAAYDKDAVKRVREKNSRLKMENSRLKMQNSRLKIQLTNYQMKERKVL
ncbi:hypothetical protein Cgig2_024075 [Carnegiea gigantea]|uniref:Uncharacterized protein n=1 Tax=Carnegiea gigantea TaxID=171969 RepID=A0A9Q1K5Q0_9CARY|nr:hypothetical protein Cgig2_024075 [Carnegiea gigantea]